LTEYCSKLYKNTAKGDTVGPELEAISPPYIDDQGIISPPSIDDQRNHILLEEVKKVIKQLKGNKSLGTYSKIGEAIQAGGIKLAKEIHKICEKAWQEGKIPKKWIRSILVTNPKNEISRNAVNTEQ